MSDDYFDRDAVSATLLKAVIKQSPVHAVERMRAFEPTANMKLGTALHAKVLEPKRCGEILAVSPDVDRRTKAGKEAYAEFLENVENKTVITASQNESANEMRCKILEHPQAVSLLKDSQTEVEKYFEYDCFNCKAKIDAIHNEGFIVDVKTTVDASPDAFAKQSANLLYHMQLAWYAKSVGRSWKDCDCYVIAVENTMPHSVAVYHYERDALEFGWKLCKRAVRIWKDYLADVAIDGKSFAYGTDALDLILPAWAERV